MKLVPSARLVHMLFVSLVHCEVPRCFLWFHLKGTTQGSRQGLLTLEDGTDMLSRNVRRQLPHDAV
jgi:hypothetical protein